jgi:hypothetical protein
MGYEREDDDQQVQGDDRHSGQSALESAARHLAGGTGPGRSYDASRQEFSASFRAPVEWGQSTGRIRLESDFAFFDRPPDGFGDEHEAWFDEPANRWFKATYRDRFGLAWGRNGSATPGQYLTRLLLQNRYFSDDIELVTLLNSSGHLRVLTSQRHIAGEPATAQEIQAWFLAMGFKRLESAGRVAWYESGENLLVADAHEGNVIKTASGVLVPIDLNLVQPSGDLHKWVLAGS